MNTNLRRDGFRLVSNSEIQTFKDCRRKWWLGWYLGMTPRLTELHGVRKTGDRIHIALAALYTPNATHDDCRNALEDTINADGLVAVATGQMTKELKSQFDLERAMIEGYLEWVVESGVDARLEVLSSETYLEAALPADTVAVLDMWHSLVKLIGKIDARVRDHDTGRDGFIDHKTAASTVIPGLNLNEQKLHYHLLHFLARDDADQRLSFAYWNVLKRVKRTVKATPPFYSRYPVNVTEVQLKNHMTMTVSTVEEIIMTEGALDTGVTHHRAVPRRFSETCHWKCPFFKICPMFDDGSNVAGMLDDQFIVRDPLSYYGGKENGDE